MVAESIRVIVVNSLSYLPYRLLFAMMFPLSSHSSKMLDLSVDPDPGSSNLVEEARRKEKHHDIENDNIED